MELILNSNLLGEFRFLLQLNALSRAADHVVQFQSDLGSLVTKTVQVPIFLRQPPAGVDLICAIEYADNPDAKYEPSESVFGLIQSPTQDVQQVTTVSVPATTAGRGYQDMSLQLNYRPTSIGSQQAELVVSYPISLESRKGARPSQQQEKADSMHGIELYRCTLQGRCVAPRPQGPVHLQSGENTSIVFTNVMQTSTEFSCHVDEPAFSVTKPVLTIGSGSSAAINLQFKATKNSHTSNGTTGKLVIRTASLPGVQWIYYLQGH